MGPDEQAFTNFQETVRHVKDPTVQGNHIGDFALHGYLSADAARSFCSVQMDKIQVRVFFQGLHQGK